MQYLPTLRVIWFLCERQNLREAKFKEHIIIYMRTSL
jgi:hypothetical protein